MTQLKKRVFSDFLFHFLRLPWSGFENYYLISRSSYQILTSTKWIVSMTSGKGIINYNGGIINHMVKL